jgi:ribosomal protein L17
MSPLVGLRHEQLRPILHEIQMATRTLSRRALREQHDQTEIIEQESTETTESQAPETKVKKTRVRKEATKKPAAVKAPAKPRARKKAVKVPPRLVARWAVCDGGFKRVAVFDYKDRAGADSKLIQLREDKKGPFFLQLVKDPYDPPVVVPVPAV